MRMSEPTTHRSSMLSYAVEPPNVISLLGLASAILAIYFAILGVFPAAMIGLVWAVAFDWFDGLVARAMKDRTDQQRSFGSNLDSLIDVVSFGVAPAVLLLSVGGFGFWFVPGAIIILFTAVVRLGYFNVFGLLGGSTYRGLALDNNVIIVVLIFVLQPVLGIRVFAIVLYVVLMVLACLNVSSIPTPKLGGKWYSAVFLYALSMSAVYGWRLFTAM